MTVLICSFVKKNCNRLLFHVICYFKMDKISGKYQRQGKASWVSVVAGYRNKMYCYQNTVLICGKYTHTSQWEGHCSVCRDAQYFVSQSMIVSLLKVICKCSVENHFLDLDVNVIVIIDIGLKELARQVVVNTELSWVVIGCCGIVL